MAEELNNDLSLEDLDVDLDDLEGLDTEVDEEERIPKKKVSEIVQRRLAKERAKQRDLVENFRRVYGMTPEEAIDFASREVQKAQPAKPAPKAQTAEPTSEEQEGVVDPLAQKVMELDNWRQELEERQQREREAQEFVQKFPDIKFEDIPREVLDRRAQGGVTLAEAYKLFTADKMATEAAKKASAATIRNIRSRDVARAEGDDYSGGASDAGSLAEDERDFAKLFGMSPKEYIAYKMKAQRYKKEEG